MENLNKGLDLNNPESTTPSGKNYLLGIAIDEYLNCSRLNNAVKDVQAFIDLVKARYNFDESNITFIKNNEATKKRIENEFFRLTRMLTPQDNLIVYFSGHGRHDKDFGGNWVPVDAGATENDWPDYLSNDSIKSHLGRINCLHTFLIADSCFSGSLFIDKSREKFTGDRRETEPSRWGLTSGKREIVSDGEPGKHSPFATALLDVLDKADQPPGAMRICDLVLEKVAANAQQTPMGSPLAIKGHQGGQFVFHFRSDENTDWVSLQNSPDGCRRYLSQYPNGKFRQQAEAILAKDAEDKAWQAAVSSKNLRTLVSFEKQFPESSYISSGELDQQIASIEEDALWKEATRSNSVAAYRDYLRRTRQGKYRQEANTAMALLLQVDDEAVSWKNAQETDSRDAYEAYLRQYPTGAHSASAKAAIVKFQLETEEKERREQEAAARKRLLDEENKKKEEALSKETKPEEPIVLVHSYPEPSVDTKKYGGQIPETPPAHIPTLTPENSTLKFIRSPRVLIGIGGILLLLFAGLKIREYFLSSDRKKQATSAVTVFQLNGKYGYQNAAGEIIIAAEYDSAGIFQNGQARVVKNGRGFTIDKKNNCIADCLEAPSIKGSEEPVAEDISNKDKAEVTMPQAALSFKHSIKGDKLTATFKAGTPPYQVKLMKGGDEKYSKSIQKPGTYTIVLTDYRKTPGTYELVIEDAKGEMVKREVKIDAASPPPVKKQFDKGLGQGLATLVNGAIEITYANCEQSCSFPSRDFVLTYCAKRQDPVPVANQGLTFSTRASELLRRAKPGDWYYVVFDDPKINNIVVEVQGASSTKLKSAYSPTAFARLGDATGSRIGSSSFKTQAQDGLTVELANCLHSCYCAVNSFDFVYLPKRQDAVVLKKSNGLDVAEQVNRAKPGDMYFFTNIKATCSVGGKDKTIDVPPLVYYMN